MLLLDTHVYIWWLQGVLPAGTESTIRTTPQVFVSAASLWEISIKVSLGKLRIDAAKAQDIEGRGFKELQVSARHAWEAGALPPVHKDPFDRLLVAQASLEGLTLVSADSRVWQYPVDVLRVT